jgi:ADP-ribose pyrophosphatase YjhB (NUDIX family)
MRCHPKMNDDGKPVWIHHPNMATPMSAFADSNQVICVLPGGGVPDILNLIPLRQWTDGPTTVSDWNAVSGQVLLDEPALPHKSGKKPASGVVIIEPDQRVWLVSPTNRYSGYENTFPKGTLDAGLNLQANTIKEAFEESGLRVAIISYLGDVERSTTVTRYYFARRTGGNPADMGWESQAVHLVPKNKLGDYLTNKHDTPLLEALK